MELFSPSRLPSFPTGRSGLPYHSTFRGEYNRRRSGRHREKSGNPVRRKDFRQKKWQPCKDLNLNKVNQNHLCYHYTTGLRNTVYYSLRFRICKL